MKTKYKLSTCIVCLIIFCACSPKQKNNIILAEWLIGSWENKIPKGSIYETWNKVNDYELSGKSYTLKEKDTVVFETIKLVQEQNEMFYIPTVQSQNKGLPVPFTAKKKSKTQLVFENLQHDFPQTISYTKINRDSLVATISGMKNEQEHKQIFPMKRIK